MTLDELNLDNRMITLEDFEKQQLGSWVLAINNASDAWNNPENFEKLQNTLVSLYQEIVEKLPGLLILRGIIVTSNVLAEYDRLLSGTSRKARVDAPRAGVIAGKVLTWGDCNSAESYFTVIVIEEHICASAIFEDELEGKALIIHEFAHVAEGYFTSSAIGKRKGDIYHNEWEKIRFSIATSVFSEYFAQLTSYPYYKSQETLASHINHAIEFLQSVTDYLNQEISKYRFHAQMNQLWPKSVSELSRVFDQFGRSIGLLVCIDDENRESMWNKFVSDVDRINPLWVPVVNELRDSLVNFEFVNINESTFTPLTEAIQNGFNATGVIPEILKDSSLYIHVPKR